MTRTSSEPRPVLAHATAGTLRGSQENGVAVFRGIPFAVPPVGALRFAAPRPVRAGRACGPPWISGRRLRRAWVAEDTQGDDWLTVNVWIPKPDPGAGRAVMVWIDGGG